MRDDCRSGELRLRESVLVVSFGAGALARRWRRDLAMPPTGHV